MTLTAMRPDVEVKPGAPTATRLALVIEYDGTSYYGFQLQAGQPTIQAALEEALKALTGEAVRVATSSRTDTGVHARGQVVSFKTHAELPLEAYVRGLNHHLPGDIAVRSAHRVGLDFNPRGMATSREYVYTVLNSGTRSPLRARTAHRISGRLDIQAMNQAGAALLGTHDCASFASDIGDEPDRSTVRHIHQAEVARDGDIVTFTVVANAFVRHQIRNTAGALVQVGLGKMSLAEFNGLIEAKQPGLAGPTLPACGLCLVRVNYPAAIEEMGVRQAGVQAACPPHKTLAGGAQPP